MGMIGRLGEVLFHVSSSVVRTLDNMQWSGSAQYATHQRQGINALTEFVALDPDKISFDIYLATNLSTDPMKDISTLWGYLRTGKSVQLLVGNKYYGKYRWVITNLNIGIKTFNGKGEVVAAQVSLSLLEYLRE